MEESKPGPGGCTEIALRESGIDTSGLDIPAWCTRDDVKDICDKLGLVFIYENSDVTIGNGKVIVSTETGRGTLHAEAMQAKDVPPNCAWLILVDAPLLIRSETL